MAVPTSISRLRVSVLWFFLRSHSLDNSPSTATGCSFLASNSLVECSASINMRFRGKISRTPSRLRVIIWLNSHKAEINRIMRISKYFYRYKIYFCNNCLYCNAKIMQNFNIYLLIFILQFICLLIFIYEKIITLVNRRRQ